MNLLVSLNWLVKHLDNQDIVILDCSFNIDKSSYKTIPNALYFDIKHVFSDQSSKFPNTVPSTHQFEKECRNLGISNSSIIVVFDHKGIYSSARAWWLFKIMGHDNVYVLDGGLPEWVKQGQPIEQFKQNSLVGNFKASLSSRYIKTYKDVNRNLSTRDFLLVDARSEGRFKGIDPEPRKTLQSGHIPQSCNIPYAKVLRNGKFKNKEELQIIFKDLKISEKEIVFSCGSGITACIVMLAYEIAYTPSRYLYDGSWTEWAEMNGLLIIDN